MPKYKCTMIVAEWHEFVAFIEADDEESLDMSGAYWESAVFVADVDSVEREFHYELIRQTSGSPSQG